MAFTSSSSSVTEFCPENTAHNAINHRNLRAHKAPLKAIHTQEDCCVERASKEQPTLPIQPTRETTKRCAVSDVTNEQGAFADSSAFSAKRSRLALGTQALVASRQDYTPQHLQQRPNYLSAVCSVPLPPLYGCCAELPVGPEGVQTRSMETQTSGVPNDFYSKYHPIRILAMFLKKETNRSCFIFSHCSACKEVFR